MIVCRKGAKDAKKYGKRKKTLRPLRLCGENSYKSLLFNGSLWYKAARSLCSSTLTPHAGSSRALGCLGRFVGTGLRMGPAAEKPDGDHRMSNVSMRQMLEAGVHFGHQTRF